MSSPIWVNFDIDDDDEDCSSDDSGEEEEAHEVEGEDGEGEAADEPERYRGAAPYRYEPAASPPLPVQERMNMAPSPRIDLTETIAWEIQSGMSGMPPYSLTLERIYCILHD